MTVTTKRLLALTLLALMSLGGTALPAAAEQTASQQPVVVVADFSGSMNEADADAQGTTRIAAAKQAVKGLLAEAPPESRLGVVVYGANNDSCSDIETINPVGSFDATALGSQVDSLEAKGNTPIGPALTHAAKEFDGIEGPRSIVLVSDGEPNCEPPPACDVAKDLAAQGIELAVHTIGFKIAGNAKAEQTLQCIADATGGTYQNVDDASGLGEALKQEAMRALVGYQSAGTEVGGGVTMDKPERLVAGQYVVKMTSGDDLDEDASMEEEPNRRYFAVPYHEGWRTTVSATLVPPEVETGAESQGIRRLTVEQYDIAGDSCSGARANDYASTSTSHTEDLTVSMTVPDEKPKCTVDREGQTWIPFTITRRAEQWADQELDVEFIVAYHQQEAESAAVDPGQAPGELQAGESQQLAGGSSFNNATVLKPGQTISDDVAGFERRYFAVPVEYGQNLRVQLTAQPGGHQAVAVHAFNPLRQSMRFANQGPTEYLQTGTDSGQNTPVTIGEPLENAIMPTREGDSKDELAAGFPGMQFVTVGRVWLNDTDDAPLDYTLTVDTWGEAADGGIKMIMTPEEYEAEFGSPETAASPSPSPSATEEAEAPSETPTETEDASEDATAEEVTTEATEGGDFPLVPVLGGAGVLLVAGGGGWWLLRRRG